MSFEQWYVEVIYPRAFLVNGETACPWYWKPYAGEGEKVDARPRGPTDWEDTFAFQSHERAQKFAKYTETQFGKWPDTCQGESFVIRILRGTSDSISGEQVHSMDGTIGSKKPN